MNNTNQFRIDSHKLHLHPERVARWLAGEMVPPIYMEVSPSGGCNHRCSFCGMDFLGYKSRLLPADVWKDRLTELGQIGLRSIMYAGEGEPFIHPRMPELTEATKKAGIDVAFTTNGVLLSPPKAEKVLSHTSWIKVSCNAGSAENYARIHSAKADDFNKVLRNLAEAVKIRSALKSSCTLGAQMVLLPENRHEAVMLAERVRDIGADYLVIKPYFVSRQSDKDTYLSLAYDDCGDLARDLAATERPGFSVIFRREAMQRKVTRAPFSECRALPFWGYVDAGGGFWGCLRHIGEPAFAYGNICETSFAEILASRTVPTAFSIEDCHVNCRMDPVNHYLWALAHPGPHANFI